MFLKGIFKMNSCFTVSTFCRATLSGLRTCCALLLLLTSLSLNLMTHLLTKRQYKDQELRKSRFIFLFFYFFWTCCRAKCLSFHKGFLYCLSCARPRACVCVRARALCKHACQRFHTVGRFFHAAVCRSAPTKAANVYVLVNTDVNKGLGDPRRLSLVSLFVFASCFKPVRATSGFQSRVFPPSPLPAPRSPPPVSTVTCWSRRCRSRPTAASLPAPWPRSWTCRSLPSSPSTSTPPRAGWWSRCAPATTWTTSTCWRYGGGIIAGPHRDKQRQMQPFALAHKPTYGQFRVPHSPQMHWQNFTHKGPETWN